ncbi:nucleolysin TIAR-like isoform X2 [Symsagittifera roscoffensis]
MKYAFVEFTDNSQAAAVKSFMNEREIHGSVIRINWKTQPRKDTSTHYHIFVGDLSPEVTNDDLMKLFCKCGEVSDAKVIRDANTNKSKGYGFVSFVNKKEAERAKDSLNGTMVGSRAIRINWAARKPTHGVPDHDSSSDRNVKAQNYKAIAKQASETNTTVYVGNVTTAISEESLRDTFESHGQIQSINMFPQKGYAFVIYYDHDSATKAIAHANGAKIDGVKIKCNWGRENTRPEGRADHPEYPNYGYGEDRTFDDPATQQHSRGGPPPGGAPPPAPYSYGPQYGGFATPGYDPNYYYPPQGPYPPPMYPPHGPPPPHGGQYGPPPPGHYPPPGPYGGPPPHPGYGGPPPPGYGPPPPHGYPPMDPNYAPHAGGAPPQGSYPPPEGYGQGPTPPRGGSATPPNGYGKQER